MDASELRKVLDEHSTHERNKDSFFVLSSALIILAGMAAVAVAKWVWGRAQDRPYKPPCKPRAPVITQRYRK